MRNIHIVLLISAGLFAFVSGLLGGMEQASAQRIQWFVDVREDPISQRPLLDARIITADGFRLRLFKQKDNSIWGEFVLPRGSREILSADRLPIYQIDSNDRFDLQELKTLESTSEPTLWKLDGRTLQFILWGAAKPGYIPAVLRQMMLGTTMTIRYFTILGDTNTAEIPLRRANQAIAQFLRVRPLDPESATAAPDESFTTIANDFLDLCEDMRFTGNGEDYTKCRNSFALCTDTPDQTIDSFKDCLGIVPNDPANPAQMRIEEEPKS